MSKHNRSRQQKVDISDGSQVRDVYQSMNLFIPTILVIIGIGVGIVIISGYDIRTLAEELGLFKNTTEIPPTFTSPSTSEPTMPTETKIPDSISSPPTSTPTPTRISSMTCDYAILVRDLRTSLSIANAEITLEYQLDSYRRYTDEQGRHRDTFPCDEQFPRYQLHINAEGYQPYYTEFILQEEIGDIYLVPIDVQLCPYGISVLDSITKERVDQAEIHVVNESKRFTVGNTDKYGYYESDLPCPESMPNLKIWVYAEGYEPYNVNSSLPANTEIYLVPEQRLPPSTPTPTVTPIRFSPGTKDEVLVLVAGFWLPDGEEDKERIALSLKTEIEKGLANHAQIRVEYWAESIPPNDGGSELALQIGSDPAINADFVIWGYRVLAEKQWEEDEVYVYLEVVQDELPSLKSRYNEKYGPSEIQSSMFAFKNKLGTHWAGLTAFATGLSFYQSQAYQTAELFFSTAETNLLDPPTQLPLEREMVYDFHFYQAKTYLALDQLKQAEAQLQRAIQISEEINHPDVERTREEFAQVQAQLNKTESD